MEGIIIGIIAALPNSSRLSFEFEMPRDEWQRVKRICLPVSDISNWLTRKIHQQSGKKGEQNMAKERSLFISIHSGRVRNYTAMSKCVEKVANYTFLNVLYDVKYKKIHLYSSYSIHRDRTHDNGYLVPAEVRRVSSFNLKEILFYFMDCKPYFGRIFHII